jgi:hypothetical protein
LWSKIRVTCQTTDDCCQSVALAAFHTNIGTSSDSVYVAASRNAKPAALKVLAANGYGPAVVLEDSISTSVMVGDALYDEIGLYGLGNADPATQFYWVIGCREAGLAASAVNLFVELEYMVEWSSAIDLP